MACAVALLMIGGEFDLSAGVAVTTSSLAASMIAYNLHLNLWVGAILALVVSLAVGFFNGYLVMKTKIPSFLITLSSFLMLTGINLAVTKLREWSGGHTPASPTWPDSIPRKRYSRRRSRSSGCPSRSRSCGGCCSPRLQHLFCSRPRSATGSSRSAGNQDSARAIGVPVTAVKIGLFMTVGFAAWFVGMHLLFSFNTVQSGQGCR